MVLILTIRPVDLQVIIPRVTEVGKSQHVGNHQETLQQQQFADKWQHISTNRQKQVQSAEKSDSGKIRRENQPKEEQQAKKDEQKRSSKSKEADMENHASNEDPVRGNLIDIKT